MASVRVSVCLTAEEFEAARAAYVADWVDGGPSDTFGRWVAAVIARHAGRTVEERAAVSVMPRAWGRRDVVRSFTVPASVVERMRAAIAADDEVAGRWSSGSAWCGEALARAVQESRARCGGVLPVPSSRLPNRLER